MIRQETDLTNGLYNIIAKIPLREKDVNKLIHLMRAALDNAYLQGQIDQLKDTNTELHKLAEYFDGKRD